MSVDTIQDSDHITITNALYLQYSVVGVKAELDQIVKGLEAYRFQKWLQLPLTLSDSCPFQTVITNSQHHI